MRSHETGEAVQSNLLQQSEEAVQQMYLLSPLNNLPSEPTQQTYPTNLTNEPIHQITVLAKQSDEPTQQTYLGAGGYWELGSRIW